jgi:hypothetical protein
MVDTVQLVLLVVIIALTLLLIILGTQVFLILRELRRTIRKANRVLDNTGSITESVSKPISSLSNLVGTVSTSAVLAKVIKIALGMASNEKKKDQREE